MSSVNDCNLLSVNHILWRHKMETLSPLLALCEGNPPVTGGFHTQRPATRSFDILFDLHLNKRLNKQSRRRWFETPSRSLWRRCNDTAVFPIVHACTAMSLINLIIYTANMKLTFLVQCPRYVTEQGQKRDNYKWKTNIYIINCRRWHFQALSSKIT